MKFLWTFLLLALNSPIISAQFGAAPPAPPPMRNVNNGLISSNNSYGSNNQQTVLTYEEALLEYERIDGSPFLHNGEIKVDLVYYTDSLLHDVRLLYDLFNQEIVVKNDDGSHIILDPIYYKEFRYTNEDGDLEIYKRVNRKDFYKFYKILYENDEFALCSYWLANVVQNTRQIPGQETNSRKFLNRKIYYVVTKDGATQVKLGNEGAIEHIPNAYKRQVPGLKKSLKIKKLKKEKDYIQLMNAFE